MEKNEKDTFKWRNQDWVWLTTILVLIIIVIVANFYSGHKLLKVNFGIISSAVSIALAILAIALSLKQDSDNRYTNGQVNTLLNSLSGDLSTLKQHMINIKPSDLNDARAETVAETSNEMEETYTKDELEKKINEALDIFENKLLIKQDNLATSPKEIAFEILETNPDLTAVQLSNLMYRKYNIGVTTRMAAIWIKSFKGN